MERNQPIQSIILFADTQSENNEVSVVRKNNENPEYLKLSKVSNVMALIQELVEAASSNDKKNSPALITCKSLSGEAVDLSEFIFSVRNFALLIPGRENSGDTTLVETGRVSLFTSGGKGKSLQAVLGECHDLGVESFPASNSPELLDEEVKSDGTDKQAERWILADGEKSPELQELQSRQSGEDKSCGEDKPSTPSSLYKPMKAVLSALGLVALGYGALRAAPSLHAWYLTNLAPRS